MSLVGFTRSKEPNWCQSLSTELKSIIDFNVVIKTETGKQNSKNKRHLNNYIAMYMRLNWRRKK